MIKKIQTFILIIIIIALSLTLLLRLIHIETKVVLSDSMYPSIRKNDLVYINHSENINIEVNDIIAFNLGDSEVLHRVINIDGQIITTKGDHNDISDAPINFHDVTGKYLFKIPFGGYLINIYIWMIILGIYGTLYIIKKINKEFRKE